MSAVISVDEEKRISNIHMFDPEGQAGTDVF